MIRIVEFCDVKGGDQRWRRWFECGSRGVEDCQDEHKKQE